MSQLSCCGKRRRSGEIASVMASIHSAERPVTDAISAVGSGPRVFVTAAHASHAAGARQASQVSVLRTIRGERFMVSDSADRQLREQSLPFPFQKFLLRSMPAYIEATWSLYPLNMSVVRRCA